MQLRILSDQQDFIRYDQWVKNHPQGTLWQSIERKKYLDALGKEARIYILEDGTDIHASALVMIDKTSFGLSTWDIPRGPIGDAASQLLAMITKEAEKEKVMTLYWSPTADVHSSDTRGRISARHIHCEATSMVNLTQTEEEILKQMKQKGRYNIKVAQKHDIEIVQSDNVEAFYKLVEETGERDGFTHLSKKKYETFLESLDGSFLMLAMKDTKAIAGLVGVLWNGSGIYYYGASSYEHRALMAPYALQWETMRFCKKKGCYQYDLLGIAPPDAAKNHPWKGITNFKEKFGGDVITYPPEKQIVLRPIMARLLQIKRKIF